MTGSQHKTLREAKAEVRSKLDEGVTCPCCDQYARAYKRKLNSGMARSLCWLVRVYQSSPGWVDVPKTAPRHVIKSNEIGKLVHWGLVEQKVNTDTSKRCSGVWRPTKRGVDFVMGTIRAPRRVRLYNNIPLAWEKKYITIYEALGDHFDYAELMGFAYKGL